MATIEDYAVEIQAKIQEDLIKQGWKLPLPVIAIKTGKKFHKLLMIYPPSVHGSAHCFVEISTGDIYKAATYNAPAKGVRGNINNEKKPLQGYDFYNYYK